MSRDNEAGVWSVERRGGLNAIYVHSVRIRLHVCTVYECTQAISFPPILALSLTQKRPDSFTVCMQLLLRAFIFASQRSVSLRRGCNNITNVWRTSSEEGSCQTTGTLPYCRGMKTNKNAAVGD
ncbi:Uncharacterized protein APZ42_018060 [Daphnia magna]|uniref:Uncharacterized protein n=1 Tax=Daphnia magna TaxID=35525 RepID=A0A164ZHW8_9CRUS|nr:Uncharacterized protein APZ42_018060 [Daphnia magna]